MMLTIICLYFAAILAVGHHAHRFFRGTSADYFLGSRAIGPFLMVMTLFGTSVTSFTLVGSVGEAFHFGIGVFGMMASWSALIHPAVFYFFGLRLWAIGKKHGFNTQTQFFRDRFESPGMGLVLFPLLTLLVIPYVLMGILGGGATLQEVTAGTFPTLFPETNGGIPRPLGAAAVCAVVLIYVFGGGLRSTAWANAAQTMIFMIFAVVAFFLIANALGGLRAASQAVAETSPEILAHGSQVSHMVFFTYFLVPLSAAMFPHLFQHWLTAKNARTFRAPMILQPLFILILWVPMVMLGVWATAILPHETSANAVIGVLIKDLTSPLVTGFMTVGILAAIMSTLDSQFLALSSMFTHDVVLHHGGEARFNDRQRVWIGRIFVLAIVSVAYAISLMESRAVFTLGVWCFSGFACLVPMLTGALYWKRTTAAGCYASMAVSAVLWLWLFRDSGWGANRSYVFPNNDMWGMLPVAPIFAASAITLVVVSLLTRPPSTATIEKYFPGARKRLK